MFNTFVYVKPVDQVMVVFSNNIDDEVPNMHLVPESQWTNESGQYDPEWISCVCYPSTDIHVIGGLSDYFIWKTKRELGLT